MQFVMFLHVGIDANIFIYKPQNDIPVPKSHFRNRDRVI